MTSIKRAAAVVLCCWLIGIGVYAWGQAGLRLRGVAQSFAGASSTYVGPGDVVASAGWWFGFRGYSRAVAITGTQKAVQLSRTSDSRNCYILIATNGAMGNTGSCSNSGDNGTAPATWCNATTCEILGLVDQTGNLSNIGVSGGTSSSVVVTFNCAGTTKPCVHMNGVGFGNVTASLGANPTTFSLVTERTGATTSFQIILDTEYSASSCPTQGAQADFNNSANTVYLAGSNGGTITSFTKGSVNDNVLHALQDVAAGASSVINADGSETTGTATSSGNSTLMNVGSRLCGGFPVTGYLFEAGIWPSAFTSGKRTSMCQNQQAFYGSGNFGATC